MTNNESTDPGFWKDDPPNKYLGFKIHFATLCSNECEDIFENGLWGQGVGICSREWDLLHPGEPRPAKMVKPVLPADASVAVREQHKVNLEEHRLYVVAMKRVLAYLIASLSTALFQITWDPLKGHFGLDVTHFLYPVYAMNFSVDDESLSD